MFWNISRFSSRFLITFNTTRGRFTPSGIRGSRFVLGNHYRIQCISCSCYLSKAVKELRKEDLPPVKRKREVVTVWRNMKVKELAKSCNKRVDVIFEAMIYVPGTDVYDTETTPIDDMNIIRAIARKLGLRTTEVAAPKPEVKKILPKDIVSMPVRNADLARRPPIVTIMGHVDHGKTTLLDSLRNSNVVAMEAGGITQAIGAFQVKIEENLVTFIDTPGHAAFYAMRNRGAHATDIVVLVVAADDGVMEQTKESITMAQNAKVPIIVAINKIDKPGADIDRAKKMLLGEGVVLEEYGGDIISVPVSALKSTNLTALVEAIITQAELMSLKAESKGFVEGVVVESRLDQGRGKICSGIVQRGKLRKGAYIVAGTSWAKVRNMFDERGSVISAAGPSTPVEIIGWKDLPSPGDKIFEVESEKRAKDLVEYRSSLETHEKQKEDLPVIAAKYAEWQKEYQEKLKRRRSLGLRRMRRESAREKQFTPSNIPALHVIVKGDVDGAVESFLDVIDTYDCEDQCRLEVVHYGVGDVTEGDVKLAETFQGRIYGYNVSMPKVLESRCELRKIEFRKSRVIYRLVEALKRDIESVLIPLSIDDVVGEANVLQVFVVHEGRAKVPVCGARCIKGTLKKDLLFKLVRGPEEEVLFDGRMYSMRHLKDEVPSITNNMECGLMLQDFQIQPEPGDKIICYQKGKVPQKSRWTPEGF